MGLNVGYLLLGLVVLVVIGLFIGTTAKHFDIFLYFDVIAFLIVSCQLIGII